MYILDLFTNEWEDITKQIEGEAPEPRTSHSAAVIDNKMYIFGGLGSDKSLMNDVHYLDLGKNEFSLHPPF